MNRFEFPRIGRPLVESLVAWLTAGQSVALLGGRYVGKRYLVRHVYQELAGQSRPVEAVAFLETDEAQEPFEGVRDRFLQALPHRLESPEAVVEWWRANRRPGDPSSANLLLANLDGLPDPVASRMVHGLQAIDPGGILMTGEAFAGEYFRGPRPRIQVERVLVVSHFTPEEFRAFALRYLCHMGLLCPDPESLVAELYARTGGNLYFLRVLLWLVFDYWAAFEEGGRPTVDLSRLPVPAVAAQIPWNHYLRNVTRMIGDRPLLWDRLEALVTDGQVAADSDNPDLLELTGIPLREGDVLHLPGQLLAGFLKHHYTAQKFADLYAGRGDWERAFRRLERLSAAKRVRPARLDDIPDTAHMVRRLATSLYQKAAEGTAAVRRQFAQGCRLVLGFEEVTFWFHGPRSDSPWRGLDEPDRRPTDWVRGVLDGTPPEAGAGVPLYPLPEADRLRGLAGWFPADHPACRAAVVVRDLGEVRPLSQTRIDLLRELFEEFLGAYRHALEDEKFRRGSRISHELNQVVTEILTGLDTDVQTTARAVNLAAGRLREKRNYRRVLVSLLDAPRERVQGYCESKDEADPSLLDGTDFALSPPDQSIHVECLLRAQAIPVADFRSDRRSNSAAAARVGLLAGAVVPLDTGRRAPDGRPVLLGTLLVERRDDLPPDDEELADLADFGRKLAGVIERSERVQLLQATLDKQRESLAIIDAGGYLRYANRPAADLVGQVGRTGWRHPEGTPFIDWEQGEVADNPVVQVKNAARICYWNENRFVDLIPSPPRAPAGLPGSWIVVTDLVKDEGPGRPRRLGVFCEGENLSTLFHLFQGLQNLLHPDLLCPEPALLAAESEPKLTEQVIDELGRFFTTDLGHPVAHFDEFDGASRSLVRRRAYHPGAAAEVLPAGRQTAYPAEGIAVACFEEPALPRAFYFDDKGQHEDGTLVITPMGLRAQSVRSPRGAPGGLLGGNIWVDFPLIAGKRWLGKLVFACHGDFPPEDFALLCAYLRLLCGLVGVVLELAARYERAYKAQLRQREQAAAEAVENLLHNIRRPFRDLQPALAVLRRVQPNERTLATALEEVTDAIARFDRYSELVAKLADLKGVNPNRNELSQLIREMLGYSAPRGSHAFRLGPNVTNPEAPFHADVDRNHLELAFSELVENSRKYFAGKALQITITLDAIDDRGSVLVEYADNGPGIPAADKQRVFERGYVVQRPGRKRSSGLGLHYVSEVVRLHGGRIREEGQEGAGVRFVMEFPRYQPNPSQAV
jgi:signal transduction histidine kinase